MSALISIIIPVYNSEQYLEKCLDSVLAQDYPDLEIIVINDGSTDSSGSILERYSGVYPCIRYIQQENSGVSAARNHGIKVARGKYIAFVDSDDTIPPNYISALYRIMMEDKVELSIVSVEDSYGNIYKLSSPTDIDFEKKHTYHFLSLNKLFLLYGPYAKLFSSTIIQKYHIGFPEDLSYGEDLVFNCRYISKINRLAYRPLTSYNYFRDNGCSLSQKLRPDRYEIELRLNEELKSLFTIKHVYNSSYQQYLDERLLDEGYNSIFDILKSSFRNSEKRLKIRVILTDPHFQTALRSVPRGKYSLPLLLLFRIRTPRLIMIYYRLRT